MQQLALHWNTKYWIGLYIVLLYFFILFQFFVKQLKFTSFVAVLTSVCLYVCASKCKCWGFALLTEWLSDWMTYLLTFIVISCVLNVHTNKQVLLQINAVNSVVASYMKMLNVESSSTYSNFVFIQVKRVSKGLSVWVCKWE